MKRNWIILTAVSLTLLLAGCASSGKQGDTSAAAESAVEAKTDEAEQEDTAAGQPDTAVSRAEDTADQAETAAEQTDAAADAADSVLSFETVDLEGNTVRSEDIFSKNKITMVNIWGTFCGPCIAEMPYLEELSGRLAEKECGVVGIVCDAAGPEDTEQIKTAKEIIETTGVTYQNLLPWDGFDEALPAMFIPTTYFVNAEGQITGEPTVGAKSADEYEVLLDEILQNQ